MYQHVINVMCVLTDRGVSGHRSTGRKSARRQANFSCFVQPTEQKTQAAWGRPTAASERTAGKVRTRDFVRVVLLLCVKVARGTR